MEKDNCSCRLDSQGGGGGGAVVLLGLLAGGEGRAGGGEEGGGGHLGRHGAQAGPRRRGVGDVGDPAVILDHGVEVSVLHRLHSCQPLLVVVSTKTKQQQK